ncbi:MAG: polysaccharide pyruvyl transferase family protein [Phormidesmis sp.]
MKLFYYQTTHPSKNFGDELNPWLWPRLLPFDDDLKTVFVGIGTVLNDATPDWVNHADNAIFFSTGAGYGQSLRLKKQPNWRIYCVRGPWSARKLKLPAQLAITDGAALLKRYFSPVAIAQRKYKFSYMPHFRHGNPHRMKAVCRAAGIHYIDPAGEVEKTISAISQSNTLISEAMHGAIVADVLRVPWIPVRTSPKISLFKWRDWCASIKVPYRYQILKGVKLIPPKDYLYPVRPFLQGQGSVASLFDGMRMNAGINAIDIAASDHLCAQLEAVTKVTPYLSSEEHLEVLVVRLESRL